MKKIITIIIFVLFLTACGKKQVSKDMPKETRQPAVAGAFYKASPEGLKADIEKYLAQAGTSTVEAGYSVRAIMVPHAGYDFSAPVAAYAYKAVSGKSYRTVVLLCNSHKAYFKGIAIDDTDVWHTPLGDVEVDKEMAKKIADYDKSFTLDGTQHATDHVLEIQLPFLQTVLNGGFKIVPILFGNSDNSAYEKLSAALKQNLGDDSLVVVSSDMSHYPTYENANRIDAKTLDIVGSLDINNLEMHINGTMSSHIANEQTLLCGIDGVKTIMDLAADSSWSAIKLHYANSGDVPIGDKGSVVGYGAMAFISHNSQRVTHNEENAEADKKFLDDSQKAKLIEIARQTVESYVRNRAIPDFEISDERLNANEGAFVTLHKNGRLRGCIGRFSPTDIPLWQVVREMAVAAATQDTRFNPVAADELGQLDYEISVLSIPEKIKKWQDIQLGKQGVIVKKGSRSGVFLPQVATETGWSKEEFLNQLCQQKAGLPVDCYKNDESIELYIFDATVFDK